MTTYRVFPCSHCGRIHDFGPDLSQVEYLTPELVADNCKSIPAGTSDEMFAAAIRYALTNLAADAMLADNEKRKAAGEVVRAYSVNSLLEPIEPGTRYDCREALDIMRGYYPDRIVMVGVDGTGRRMVAYIEPDDNVRPNGCVGFAAATYNEALAHAKAARR